MKNNIINKLTSGQIKNPLTDKPIKVEIDDIVIGSGALKQIKNYLKKHGKQKVAVVSDENTHFAAGAEIERILCKDFEISSVVLPDNVHSNIENVNVLKAYTANSDVLVAVGGGTINDLCKYASYEEKKDYISVPTCPSVNGFTSANASIEENNIKKSLPAHLPKAVFADVDILVQAPERLIISGLGDSLARPTAQADWLLSHHIMGTEYNSICFEILEEAEKKLFENADKLLEHDYEAVKSLMETLILSGLSMYIAGSSNPASQAEHMIAHYMEMTHGEDIPHTFHGEQIAVTSIAMAKIQQQILDMKQVTLHPITYTDKPIMKHFGEEKGEEFLKECSQKEISGKKLSEINEKLKNNWDKIRDEINSIRLDPKLMEDIIISIKGPYTYRHLAWEHDDFKDAISYAPYIRNRFTFLDLAIGIKGFLED